MSADRFQVAYDGEGVRSGSMDVYELSPALLALGDLFKEANRTLNGDRATVSIRVESDFKTGSFEFGLLLDQGIIEQAKALFAGHDITQAHDLLAILLGAGKIVGATAAAIGGVLKLFKMLRGEPPKESGGITMIDNSITIIKTESGNVVNAESKSAELYKNPVIREAMSRVIKPLQRTGIDDLEIRRDKEVLEHITKREAIEISRFVEQSPSLAGVSNPVENSRPAFLRVTRPNFLKGKWEFSDGSSKFSAKINDFGFLGRIESREIGFYNGDVLKVDLKTVQSVNESGKIHTGHSIEHVVEYIPGPRQITLDESMAE